MMNGKFGEATRKLMPLEDMILSRQKVSREPVNIVEYTTEGPKIYGKCLHNEEAFAIQLVTIPKGSTFPSHKHNKPIVEYGIVIEGVLMITINNLRTKIGPGEHIRVPPESLHEAEALEDTRVIAVTIPRDPGFPK